MMLMVVSCVGGYTTGRGSGFRSGTYYSLRLFIRHKIDDDRSNRGSLSTDQFVPTPVSEDLFVFDFSR